MQSIIPEFEHTCLRSIQALRLLFQWTLIATFFTSLTPLSAQNPKHSVVTDPFYELQTKFKSDALQTSRALTEYYINALTLLENEAAAKADYETALDAQKRRENLIQTYNQNPNIEPLSSTLVLRASEAEVSGGVIHDRTRASLDGWKSSANSATWNVLRILPGSYQVTLIYTFKAPAPEEPIALDLNESARFEIGESSALSSGNTPPITLLIPAQNKSQHFMSVNVGKLDISRNTAKFYLKMIEDRGAAKSFILKEIRLTPNLHNSITSNQIKDPAPISEFESTLESHGLRLLELTRPHIEEYKATLNAYLSELESTKQSEIKKQIQNELKAADEYLSKPPSRFSKELSARLIIRAAAKSVLTKCKLVKGSSIQGSIFKIQTPQGEKSISIEGVHLLSTKNSDPLHLQQFTTYFSITPQQSQDIANQAQSYLYRLLGNKTFEVCFSADTDENGNPIASIFLDNGPCISTLLVTQGYAAIDPILEDASIARKTLYAVLIDTQNTAKSAQPKRGAWKYQP